MTPHEAFKKQFKSSPRACLASHMLIFFPSSTCSTFTFSLSQLFCFAVCAPLGVSRTPLHRQLQEGEQKTHKTEQEQECTAACPSSWWHKVVRETQLPFAKA